MNRSQAEAVVALVQAYFPRPELPGSTVMAWATELEPFDFTDAQEAARQLSRGYTYPVLAELIGLVDEVRRERLAREMPPPALPASEAEIVETMPNDVREKWHALQARWAETVERDPAAEDAEWERRKLAVKAAVRLRGVCDGVGQEAVEVDGRWVCPGCGEPVDEGCRPRSAAGRKAARA